MASTPVNPASPSDPKATWPAGPVTRVHAVASTDQPGTVRVVWMEGEVAQKAEGPAALTRLPELLKRPDCAAWVDLVSPSAAQAKEVGDALALHPLIVEDVLEGNQRAKIETTDGLVHIVLFHLTYGDRVIASELDIVLGRRLPAHRPRGGLGPARQPAPARGRRGRPQARSGPPAVGARRRHHRRLLPVRRPARRRHRRGPGRGRPRGQPGHPRAGLHAQARAHRRAPGDQPRPRGLQPADQPGHAARRRRRDHLLPGHLRPRHPPDRRARQLPGAGVGHARRVPDPGQQQPVGDHEAPDRRDRHPGRRRRRRRDLRDERGGGGARRARRPAGFWLITGIMLVLAGIAAASSCAGSTGSRPPREVASVVPSRRRPGAASGARRPGRRASWESGRARTWSLRDRARAAPRRSGARAPRPWRRSRR